MTCIEPRKVPDLAVELAGSYFILLVDGGGNTSVPVQRNENSEEEAGGYHKSL